jgi:hypothetical protein
MWSETEENSDDVGVLKGTAFSPHINFKESMGFTP